ncbi:MAG: hypothetical protein FD143_2943 [Ignavibacteria bacterium]|nr:MAG: hypothetical protein FD143_2943 [Ignavibacteria bacterium]KAF0157952.1 MAG: hypothetical protein FD188_2647 [Ignavibacteria bacterium]
MKLNLEKEWKYLNDAVFKNQPSETPFPKHIVAARELLLKAQVLLSIYAENKSADEKTDIEVRYKSTIEYYLFSLKQQTDGHTKNKNRL